VRLLFGAYTPEAAALVARLAVTMLFVGLLQGLAMWSLASRWSRLTLVYGIAGAAYWLTMLGWGTSLEALLRIMPVAAGAAFAVMVLSWGFTMRFAARAD